MFYGDVGRCNRVFILGLCKKRGGFGELGIGRPLKKIKKLEDERGAGMEVVKSSSELGGDLPKAGR